jgi:hypothetical protein
MSRAGGCSTPPPRRFGAENPGVAAPSSSDDAEESGLDESAPAMCAPQFVQNDPDAVAPHCGQMFIASFNP